jgi:hypothetical protein
VAHFDRRTFLATTASAAIGTAAEDARLPCELVRDLSRSSPRTNERREALNQLPREGKILSLSSAGWSHSLRLTGGNAFLYQITLAEYTELAHWLGGLSRQATIIPAVGPSYGRAIDQAPLIRRYKFPSVLVLPTGDPRDAAGLERGLREIAEACGVPLSLYVKRESDFGDDLDAGLDVIGRLVDSRVCVSIKYAVVRKDPAVDPYLTSLLRRVDRSRIISGIGERPAIVHPRNFGLINWIHHWFRRARSQAVPWAARGVLAEELRAGRKAACFIPAAGRPPRRMGSAARDSRRGGTRRHR